MSKLKSQWGFFIFLASGERMTTPTVCETLVEDSVILLTKNPVHSNFKLRSIALGARVHGISFEWFPRHWQTVGPLTGPSGVAGVSLNFFKEVGYSSGVTPS